MKIKEGVTLKVIRTAQFKTIRVAVDFIAPVTVLDLSKRVLLAQLLETSSLDYPTQKSLGAALSMMFGANYGVNVYRYGRVNGLRFSATVIDAKWLQQENLLQQIMAFLKQVIYRPLVHDGAFDEATFFRQRQNLLAYQRSLDDDKQYFADQQLQQLVYRDEPSLAASLYGDAKIVEKMDATSLFVAYETLLAKNQIQITVVGDTTEEEVLKQLSSWPLTDRRESSQNPVIKKAVLPFATKTHSQPVLQSKLNLAYHLPVSYGDSSFYAALVFNGLFGGTPISLLFKSVREKNSLAYYASSFFDSFTQTLNVKTGISADNRLAVEEIISEQLERLQTGQFSKTLFNQVVANLTTSREARLDSARALLNQAVIDDLTNQSVSVGEWVTRLQAVKIDDVVNLANQLTPQAVYFLKGGVLDATSPLP